MRLQEYVTEGKKISAAVLMSDGNRFLVVHPTGWAHNAWEIPKGRIDKGENAKQAAVREFYEETGVKIDGSKLKKIGKFPLHSEKDVIIFNYKTDKLPVTASMKSLSTFHPNKYEGDYDTALPETDNWMYITPDQIDKYVRREMRNMLKNIL